MILKITDNFMCLVDIIFKYSSIQVFNLIDIILVENFYKR